MSAGPLDHFAFTARDRAGFEQRLALARVPYQLRVLPDGSTKRIFPCDPDGVQIQSAFHSQEDKR